MLANSIFEKMAYFYNICMERNLNFGIHFIRHRLISAVSNHPGQGTVVEA